MPLTQTHAHPGTDAAIHHYDHLLEGSPTDPLRLLARAALLIEAGRLSDAEADLAHADALPAAPHTGYLRGLLALQHRDLLEARRQFDRYLETHPDDFRSHWQRGRVRSALGDSEGASRDLLAAVRLHHPFNPGLVRETAALMAATEKTAQALVLLDDALASQGNIPELAAFAVDLLIQQGRHGEALHRVRDLADSQDNPRWLLEQARLLALTKRPEEALSALVEAEQTLRARRATPWRDDTLTKLTALRTAVNAGDPNALHQLPLLEAH